MSRICVDGASGNASVVRLMNRVPFGVSIQLDIAHNTWLVLHKGFGESVGQTLDRPLYSIQYPVGDRYTDAGGDVVGVVGGGGHRTANETSQPYVRAAKFAWQARQVRPRPMRDLQVIWCMNRYVLTKQGSCTSTHYYV